MTKLAKPFLFSLVASIMLIAPPVSGASAASDFEPMTFHSGSQFEDVDVGSDGASSDTFYSVDVSSPLQAFADIGNAIAKARGSSSEERVAVTNENMYRASQSFTSAMSQGRHIGASWQSIGSIRAPGPDWDIVRTNMGGYFYGNGQTKQRVTLHDMRLLVDKAMCVVFSTAFTATVMDRNGGGWLFSAEFDDEDAAALDRAIARELEAAHQATRFSISVQSADLLPLFDRFYGRCVGDKLTAFRPLQAK